MRCTVGIYGVEIWCEDKLCGDPVGDKLQITTDHFVVIGPDCSSNLTES